VNLVSKHDFPTPEFPIINILTKYSLNPIYTIIIPIPIHLLIHLYNIYLYIQYNTMIMMVLLVFYLIHISSSDGFHIKGYLERQKDNVISSVEKSKEQLL